MSAAAIAAGLILEVHPDPEKALSDGYPSLTFEVLIVSEAIENVLRLRLPYYTQRSCTEPREEFYYRSYNLPLI